MPLRDALMRTLRCLGAGVIKSFALFLSSESTFSLVDRRDPSLRDLALLVVPGMRTTRGAGLPFDESCGDSVRDRLPLLDDAEVARSLKWRWPSPLLLSRGDGSEPSSSRRAFTEALNLGSGTSSSELSPAEYRFDDGAALLRNASVSRSSGEGRLEPVRDTAARDICRVDGRRCRPLVYAVERELGEAMMKAG